MPLEVVVGKWKESTRVLYRACLIGWLKESWLLDHTLPLNLQSFTKYLRQTQIVSYGKSSISIFQRFLASIKTIFVLALKLGTSLSF